MGSHRIGAWSAALVLSALGWLSACGNEEVEPLATDPTTLSATSADASSPSDSSTPDASDASDASGSPPPDAPGCAEVWVDGERIPRFYAGCVEDGAYVERDALGCSSGQRLVRYGGRFYGVMGGTVHEAGRQLTKDRDYLAAERRCTA